MIRRFFRDSALYTFSSILTRSISLLMLPIYVRYLSQEDFGALDYLTAISAILAVIITAEISQATMRFVADRNSDINEQNSYIANAILFILTCYVIFILFIYLLRDPISLFLFNSLKYSSIIVLTSLACCSNSFIYLGAVIYRSRFAVKRAMLISVVSSIAVAMCTFFLLDYKNMGLQGVFLGQLAGQSVIVCSILIILRKIWLRRPNKKVLQEMLSFSMPLVISSAGILIALFVDRIFIKHLLGLDAVAIYGVAARFASVASLCLIGFQSALSPLIYNNLKDVNTPRNIRYLLIVYIILASLGCLFIIFTSHSLVILVAGEKYATSDIIIQILCFAVVIQSSYVFFPGLAIAKRTKLLACLNLTNAILNAIFNCLLIPLYGVIGAAYATLASSTIYIILSIIFSEREYPVLTNRKNRTELLKE